MHIEETGKAFAAADLHKEVITALGTQGRRVEALLGQLGRPREGVWDELDFRLLFVVAVDKDKLLILVNSRAREGVSKQCKHERKSEKTCFRIQQRQVFVKFNIHFPMPFERVYGKEEGQEGGDRCRGSWSRQFLTLESETSRKHCGSGSLDTRTGPASGSLASRHKTEDGRLGWGG